jgi:hypothetical protein
MRTIVINSSNYVVGSGNAYVYDFPSQLKFNENHKLGVSGVSIYNSTFNITAKRGNNVLTFLWNADTTTSFTITIPDGYYSVKQINEFLQQQFILNDLYVVNASSQNVYFLQLLTNSTRYSVQLNSYYLPTSAQATTLGYTKPSGASWNFPATSKTPQLTFNSVFGDLIGFEAGTFPSTIQTSNQEFLSTKSPKLNVIDNYVMTCNMISNVDYSIPSDILFTIPLTAGLGSLINITPASVILNHISANHYSSIVIKFFSQDFEALELNDTELTLTLVISDDKDTEVKKIQA